MMQTRRHTLAVAGTLLAGCASWTGDRPAPEVVEHVQGAITVVDTARHIAFDGPDEIRATVRNDGYDTAVALSLYWVPRADAEPGGKSDEELRRAGYERAAEHVLEVSGGNRRTVTFERSLPGGAAGYYVRYHVLTYGARVTNAGVAARIRVVLVDTTDMRNQRPLARKTLPFDAGDQRVVTFRTRARFETFRVDAEPVDGWGESADGTTDQRETAGAGSEDRLERRDSPEDPATVAAGSED